MTTELEKLPEWNALRTYYEKSGVNLKIMDLFSNDSDRFNKYRYVIFNFIKIRLFFVFILN